MQESSKIRVKTVTKENYNKDLDKIVELNT
jgi:hypothetical protein